MQCTQYVYNKQQIIVAAIEPDRLQLDLLSQVLALILKEEYQASSAHHQGEGTHRSVVDAMKKPGTHTLSPRGSDNLTRTTRPVYM